MYNILLLSSNWEDTELLSCLNSYHKDIMVCRLDSIHRKLKSDGHLDWQINYLLNNNIDLIIYDSYLSNIKDWLLSAKTCNIPSILLQTKNEVLRKQGYEYTDFVATYSITHKNTLIQELPLTKNGITADKIIVTGDPLLDRFKRTDTSPKINTTFSKEEFLGKFNTAAKNIVCYITNKEEFDPYFKELVYLFNNAHTDWFLLIKGVSRPEVYMLLSEELKRSVNHYIDFMDELPLVDCLQFSDAVLTDNETNSIQSILLSKPTTLLNFNPNQELIELYEAIGLKNIENADNIFAPINFTTEQLNYILVNYLPCTFDGNNLNRFMLLVRFALSLREATNKYKQECIKGFLEHNVALIDPLNQSKEEAKKHLTTEY